MHGEIVKNVMSLSLYALWGI